MYLRVTRGQSDPATYNELTPLIPDVLAALRGLPGCQAAQAGIDRDTGRTIAVTTFDTLEHARFPRGSLGEPLTRLQALGWQGEAPELYEIMQ
jgi:hypothetical protein